MRPYAKYIVTITDLTDPNDPKGEIKPISIWSREKSRYVLFNENELGDFNERRRSMNWPKSNNGQVRKFGDLDFHIPSDEVTQIEFKLPPMGIWDFRGIAFAVLPLMKSNKGLIPEDYNKPAQFETPVISLDNKTCTVQFKSGPAALEDHYLYFLYVRDTNDNSDFEVDPIIKDGDSIPDIRRDKR